MIALIGFSDSDASRVVAASGLGRDRFEVWQGIPGRGQEPHAIAVGPQATDPLPLLQRLHDQYPAARLLIITGSGRLASLHQRALYAPHLYPNIVMIDIADNRQIATHLSALNAPRTGILGSWRWNSQTGIVEWRDGLLADQPTASTINMDSLLLQVHPEDKTAVESYIANAARNSAGHVLTLRITRPDGRIRHLAARGKPSFSASGDLTGIEGVFWDETEARQTEALLSSIINSAPIGMAFLDVNLRYVRVNQALAEINGIPAEDHIGKFFTELLPDLDLSILNALRHVIEKGESVLNHEVSGITPAFPGKLRYWQLSYYPVRIGNQISGAGAVCEEITVRKEIEFKIAAAERRASFLAQTSKLLAVSFDYRANIEKVLQLAAGEIASWAAIDLFCDDGSVQRLASAPAGIPDPPDAVREPLVHQGQSIGTLLFHPPVAATPTAIADQRTIEELAGRISVSVINARLYADSQLRRAKAESAMRDMEHFAYAASHDLQEPLRTISSFAQLLSRRYKGRLDPDADDFIERIVSGAGRMRDFIRDLLAYSRLTQDDTNPAGPVDMQNVLDEARLSLQTAIEESQAEIESAPLPVVPHAIEAHMLQLLQNLISNSIKYRKPHEKLRVQINATRQNSVWKFAVTDNGQGFDPKYAPLVFGIFKRLHNPEVPGTGIGLARCKKIVEQHGGQIWADAQPGQGASFYFTIPA